MSAWDHFVQRTLLDLKNGAKIPEYFGCLINLLSKQQSSNFIVDFSRPPPPPDSDDDFISLDVVKPKPAAKPKPSPVKQAPKQKPSPVKQAQETSQASLIFDSAQNVQAQPPPPAMESDSFESTPQSPTQIQMQPESESPSYESEHKTDEPATVEDEEEEVNEVSQDRARGYSEYFREIGDMVFGQYWYPIDTTIPRMTLESKLMTTFKVSKFERLKEIMLEQARKQTTTSNKLMFSRRTEEDNEENEEEEETEYA